MARPVLATIHAARMPSPVANPARFGAYNPAAGMSQVPTDLERDLVEVCRIVTGGTLNFAQSLLEQLRRRGSLSEKQMQCARDLCKRVLKPVEQPIAPAREKHALGNFSAMVALFDKAAKAKSEKAFKPKVRLLCDDVKIELSIAGPSALQPGTINVATAGGFGNSTWYGRITKDGHFEASPREKTPPALLQTLGEFARNPLDAMVSYGRKLGSCSICARTLKDPVSIDRGIGPICQARFGL